VTDFDLFVAYTGRRYEEVVYAAKVTEKNILVLSGTTKAALHGQRLNFGDNEIAELGDYIVSDGAGGYKPVDSEVWERDFHRF
jgi:hypothetical protein